MNKIKYQKIQKNMRSRIKFFLVFVLHMTAKKHEQPASGVVPKYTKAEDLK